MLPLPSVRRFLLRVYVREPEPTSSVFAVCNALTRKARKNNFVEQVAFLPTLREIYNAQGHRTNSFATWLQGYFGAEDCGGWHARMLSEIGDISDREAGLLREALQNGQGAAFTQANLHVLGEDVFSGCRVGDKEAYLRNLLSMWGKEEKGKRKGAAADAATARKMAQGLRSLHR